MGDPEPLLESERTTWRRRFRALSYDFQVESDLDGLDRVLDRLLASFRAPESPEDGIPSYTLRERSDHATLRPAGRPYEMLKDDASINRVANPGSLLDWLISDLTLGAVRSTERFLTVHAGVVALDGVAVLLPAPPDSGKTTLTVGLTRAGLSFLSDEIAAIELGSATVHPFPRPILMDPESMDVLDGLREDLAPAYEAFRVRRYRLSHEDLRPGALGGPCDVGFIVAPAYRRGAVTTLQPIGRAEAFMRLADQSFNLRALGVPGVETLAGTVRRAECYRLEIGDLASAVDAVRRLFNRAGS